MIDWSKIETVLLDMDGTLLDLYFDNYFWQTLIPTCYAEQQGMALEEAVEVLTPIFKEEEGKLNWYCLDYWTDKLSLDIVQLKRQVKDSISVLPHTREFLLAIHKQNIRCVLVTNAHKGSWTLKMQETGLIEFFDAIVCAHDMGYPKEHQMFWTKLQQLEGFNAANTLFVDDSLSVLRSASLFGLTELVAIASPDSTQPPRMIEEFTAVEHLGDLLPIR